MALWLLNPLLRNQLLFFSICCHIWFSVPVYATFNTASLYCIFIVLIIRHVRLSSLIYVGYNAFCTGVGLSTLDF